MARMLAGCLTGALTAAVLATGALAMPAAGLVQAPLHQAPLHRSLHGGTLPGHPVAVAGLAGLPEAEVSAIHRVVTAQLDAFQRDDGAAAFAHAAPAIQARFGTPERFLRMVRTAYPEVYRPRAITFGRTRLADGRIVQPVEIIGPDKAPVTALYLMQRPARWQLAHRGLRPDRQPGPRRLTLCRLTLGRQNLGRQNPGRQNPSRQNPGPAPLRGSSRRCRRCRTRPGRVEGRPRPSAGARPCLPWPPIPGTSR